ncbi:MAG TPA: NUDIX domain-containing protein [Kofleriaceae bacterium]|nr:NUDIX domain-containing protein [Kofleriaceae bacterium]
MDDVRNHPRLAEAFQQLAGVRLNPRRHTAPSALAHSEAVAACAAALARANGLGEGEVRLLEALGLVHDIGKITGTARPERSLEVLRERGVDDPQLLALVACHDTNLPWYLSHARGQPPSDRAWRRLAAQVDMRLLCLFMVADRCDAPPGWRRNAPCAWFLAEARRRGLVPDLALDLPDLPSEVSAGGALVRERDGTRELLLIRVRERGYELPKGHIEWDELPEDAAAREVREEAAVESPLAVGRELGCLDYPVGDGAHRRLKRVRYFAMTTADAGTGAAASPLALGPLPPATRERRWASAAEVDAIELVEDSLRPILAAALAGA